MAYVQASGTPGLGTCLFATQPYAVGDVVIAERPLLIGESLRKLPPLAALAPLPRADTAIKLPISAAVIGFDGWPTDTAFENRHLGLLMAFIEAPPLTQKKILAAMQAVIETAGEAPQELNGGLPMQSPTSISCRRAAETLERRGGLWDVDTWGIPFDDLTGFADKRTVLYALVTIFTVNAHSFGEQAALFDAATKLTHACAGANVAYHPDLEAGMGRFIATRPIASGELLTTSYLSRAQLQCSTAQRRRFLYAQKGFVCRCAACALVDDTYRRISYAGTTLSKRENGLWGPLLNAVGTMYTDNDLWLDVLHREGVLAAKAAKLAHAGADAGNAGRMSAARYEQVRADLQESLAVLGPDHFATQCFRRTVLMQKRAVCMELSPDERTALELHARICGEYLERCSQYLEVQTSALYVMLPSAALC
eukprot:m.751050 g.751050  ORF g.751050 m.751050 type:complete len:424 (+) comp23163_c0_seq9:99-1370(+)